MQLSQMGRPPKKKRRLVLGVGLVVIGVLVGWLGLLLLARKTGQVEKTGLNAALPAAHFKPEKPMGKLDVLEKADRDSAHRVKEDAFSRMSFGAAVDSSAGRLSEQLDRLKTLVRPQEQAPGLSLLRPGGSPSAAPVEPETQLSRLREVLAANHTPETAGADPQLDRLSGMLDKIIRIQRGSGATVDTSKTVTATIPMEKPVAETRGDEGAFLGLDDEGEDSGVAGGCFGAVIPEAQVLVAGATIAVRLTEPVTIGHVVVPRDELLYGKVSLAGDRLLVSINSVRVGSGVYPVALQVYDLDGLAGIHVPGAITRDVVKQSAAEGVNGLGMVTTDGSLGASAAEAGIQAARSLFSRKVALVRVTVPAGYRVLLRNQSLNNH